MSPPPQKRHPYDQWSPDARALDVVGDKWTLLIVRDLAGGPRRFVELQRTLPGISTEQLRSRLNRMVADDLLTRRRYREVPPRVDYDLTERARDLLAVVAEIARWGYRHAWGQPRSGERIDIGAILRATCGGGAPDGLEGAVELTVWSGQDRGELRYTLHARDGTLGYRESGEPGAHAHVTGPQEAYVEAFGPSRSRVALRFEGDRELAERLLDVVAGTAATSSAVPVA